MFKTPTFWTKKNPLSYALLPLSFIYFIAFSLIRIFSQKQKISKPVICIGNLTVGGSGKTPTAIAIGKILQEINVDFAFLSRGYGNDGSKFLRIKDLGEYKASQVGDEPLLLAEIATTFVAKDRFFAAKQIEAIKNIQAILLDDGMQNNSLHFDFMILVVDANLGFGNEFLLPSGPMREPLNSGLKKVDLVVIIGEADAELCKKLSSKKIINAKIIPLNLEKFRGKKLIAFCGLAYPEKFFSFLKKNGLEILQSYKFYDHYFYKNNELENMLKIAEERGATLITTKKDWVKFPPLFQKKISYLDIELRFENKELLIKEFKKFL